MGSFLADTRGCWRVDCWKIETLRFEYVVVYSSYYSSFLVSIYSNLFSLKYIKNMFSVSSINKCKYFKRIGVNFVLSWYIIINTNAENHFLFFECTYNILYQITEASLKANWMIKSVSFHKKIWFAIFFENSNIENVFL